MRRAATLAIFIIGVACLVLAWLAMMGVRPLGHLGSTLPGFTLDWGLTPSAFPFLALLGFLTVAVAIWTVEDDRYAWGIAGFAVAMTAVLLARSVAAFMLAWEAMAIASVALVAAHVEVRTVRRAAFSYFIVSQAGALAILGSLALLAVHAGDASFAAMAKAAPQLPERWRDAALGLAFFGFGSKAGLFPLHFWLPRAHPVAPPNGSALLSGAMLKIAIYGLILVFFNLAAPAGAGWGLAIIAVGAVSALGGILYAAIDTDLKRLLAYSSIEHIGIICIAIGAALLFAPINIILSAAALTAALFHALNHALFKGTLFLAAGRVARFSGTVDLDRMGGLATSMPWTSASVFIAILAITALPPLNGFASEWLLLRTLATGMDLADPLTRAASTVALFALVLTGGIAAACFAKVYGVAFLGRSRTSGPAIVRESFGWQSAGTGILAVICVGLGAAPLAALIPIGRVAAVLAGGTADMRPVLAIAPAMPAIASVALLPLAGGILCVLLMRSRRVRFTSTWVCGSTPTVRTQYTATAFSKPLRRIFAFVLFPEHEKRLEVGSSTWLPRSIQYRTRTAYIFDDFVRAIMARLLSVSRRSRGVQSGHLRLYLAYAAAVLILIVVVTR
jgi:hydrogenase-4 component B